MTATNVKLMVFLLRQNMSNCFLHRTRTWSVILNYVLIGYRGVVDVEVRYIFDMGERTPQYLLNEV